MKIFKKFLSSINDLVFGNRDAATGVYYNYPFRDEDQRVTPTSIGNSSYNLHARKRSLPPQLSEEAAVRMCQEYIAYINTNTVNEWELDKVGFVNNLIKREIPHLANEELEKVLDAKDYEIFKDLSRERDQVSNLIYDCMDDDTGQLGIALPSYPNARIEKMMGLPDEYGCRKVEYYLNLNPAPTAAVKAGWTFAELN